MTTLHLGVIDIPYGDETSKTTGDVAEILEDKYHIMEVFFELHGQNAADAIAESLMGAIESISMGAPVDLDPYAAVTQDLDEKFKRFILEGEVERVGIPGTPTAAARKGTSHRKKRPYVNTNEPRQSFYDTGMYADHFISWID